MSKILIVRSGDSYLATSFTHMRLLAGVHARVNCQCRALNEHLRAARMIADMWPHPTVNTLYIIVSNTKTSRQHKDIP